MKKWLLRGVIAFFFLLVIGLVVLASTIGYFGPKAPRLDHDAEFAKLAAQAYGGPVGDWSAVQALFDEFQQATTPGDSRTAAEAFEDPEYVQLKFPTLEQEAEVLGPWTSGLNSARFSVLAEQALLAHPYYQPDFVDDMDSLSQLRAVARALKLDARHAIANGDATEAVQAIEANLRLARIAEAQPTIIAKLVAIATDAVAADLTFDLLTNGEPSAEELNALAESFETLAPADPTIAIEGEWIHANVLTDRSFGESLLIPMSRSAQLFKLREIDDKMIQEMQAGTTDNAYWNNIEASLGRRYLLVELLLPAYGRFRAALREAQSTRDATRLAISIARYTAANGGPPATLDALVPQFLSEIPTDTASGEPFVYRLTSAAPGYTLYSVGTDGTDDGGEVANPEWPYKALGPRRPGDAVFIPYQEPRPKVAEDPEAGPDSDAG